MKRLTLAAALVSLPLCTLSAQREPAGTIHHWYRGNTHTHTKNSDGEATPDFAARWYREHGYQFLVITDHEYLTPVDGLNATIGAPGRFLVMRGQEVTQWSADPATRAAHVNAINSNRVVYPMGDIRCVGEGCGRTVKKGVSLRETYNTNIAAIRAAGGLAQINHPNGWWSTVPSDFYDVPDSTLYEVWNATPGANNLGGVDDSTGHVSLSTEALWDTLLTRGKVIWGVGSDDTHDYFKTQPAPYDPDVNPPGMGWVVVRADTLTPEAIVTSLRRGDFYASNGVTLNDVIVTDTALTIKVKRTGDARYRTQFIGSAGRVLADVPGLTPSYRFKSGDGYVRAVVTASYGFKAWVQPVFLQGNTRRH